MTTEELPVRVDKTNLWVRIKDNLPAVIVIGLSLGLAVAVFIRGGSSILVNTIITGGMYALLAVGLALVFGVMNIPHFAHGESFMVGGYVAFFVYNPIQDALRGSPNTFLIYASPFLGILLAGVAGAILGIVIERFIFAPLRHRTKSGWVMNAFLLTVGISFVMTNGATLTIGPNFRGIAKYWDVPTLEFWGLRLVVDRLVAFGIAIVTIAILVWFLRYTQTGRAIRAVSQDETGAQLVGINLDFIHTLTFSIATSTAAISGAALLFLFKVYPTVGLMPLYFSWYVVMLVGLGNVGGAIIGGFIVAILQSTTQLFLEINWETVVPTAIMILVLLIAPSGIFGSEVKGIQEQ
jgi:branched-chain amino acid transport system permease protein